jgi:hypothetical protein
MLWISIVFNANPDRFQVFRSMWIQIQGFDDTKLDNFTALQNRTTGLIKNCYLCIPRPSGRISGTVEASSPQKRTSSFSKQENVLTFPFLWVIFALLDPEPANQNQYNTDSL